MVPPPTANMQNNRPVIPSNNMNMLQRQSTDNVFQYGSIAQQQ